MNDENEKLLKLTTTQLAEALLTFKGKKFSLDGYRPFQEIYDCDPPMLTAKCSRQVGKTLSIGGIKTIKCVSRPFFTSLYVAPLSVQAGRFSTTYLDPFLNSPLIKKYYRDSSSKKNVYEKTLNNGSIMFLSYAETEADADRVRGVAGDALSVDEVQDVAIEALPILYETLSASPYAFKRHYGTAKSELNTLEVLFKRGNGLEWCIPCSHCSRWSIPWTFEDCLKITSGKEGPICVHCSKPIDITKGKWIAARPTIKNHLSFHLPRFVLESRANPKKWGEMQEAIKTYSTAKLSNEVFGLAAGIAGRILSLKEAMACCNGEKTSFDKAWPKDSRGISTVVMGVDWSVTGGVESYTVVTILGYDYNGKCFLLYSEKMQGIDILEQVARVIQLYHQFSCQLMCSDRGVGVLQGQLMKNNIGDEKVVMVQYVAAKVAVTYNKQGQYLAADRTMAMDLPILKMKLGRSKFETPCWDLMRPFWEDALALYEEETLNGRRVYRRDEGSPDDWLHSVVFANMAWMVLSGQYNVLDDINSSSAFNNEKQHLQQYDDDEY